MSDALTGPQGPQDSLEYLSGSDLIEDLQTVRGMRAIAVERRSKADHVKLVESTGELTETIAEAARAEERAQAARNELELTYLHRNVSVISLRDDSPTPVICRAGIPVPGQTEVSGGLVRVELEPGLTRLIIKPSGDRPSFVEVFDENGQAQVAISESTEAKS